MTLCAISVAIWTYHANAESRLLGAKNLKFSSGTSIVWYAVPIAYLWMPYKAMSEIWRSSHDPLGWEGEPVPLLLQVWWLAWVFYMFLGKLVRNLVAAADSAQAYFNAGWTNQATDLAGLVAAVTLALIVSKVNDVQRGRFGAAEGQLMQNAPTASFG